MPHLTQQRDGLQPAETFFDSFAFLLTNAIARMPRGPLINRTAARTTVILRHVRCDPHVAALIYKILGVETFVAAHRDRMIPRNLLQHEQGCVPLCRAIRLPGQSIHDRPLRFSTSRFPL